MKLVDYVKKYHDGNKAAFARAINRSPQGVSKMFRSPEFWRVVNEGDLILIVQVRAIAKQVEPVSDTH